MPAMIRLNHGLTAFVDEEDYAWLSKHKWRVKRSGSIFYACRRITVSGQIVLIFMHREIMGDPLEMEVHHINRNSLDNRRRNLKIVAPEGHKLIHSLYTPTSNPTGPTGAGC